MAHEAACLNDPYAAAEALNVDSGEDEGYVPPTQPFPKPTRVTFMDTLLVSDSFDANDEDIGTFPGSQLGDAGQVARPSTTSSATTSCIPTRPPTAPPNSMLKIFNPMPSDPRLRSCPQLRALRRPWVRTSSSRT